MFRRVPLHITLSRGKRNIYIVAIYIYTVALLAQRVSLRQA